ncbi:M20 family metallopeptidase [Ornithinimicrobium faecis]|uniref:Probable succinyl-diaminopimelate desuccinylase n=1 Tax=Ornithinimicrobium faecis TaxID=2934158 RepID=A0ABY4YRB2_9MICO|nr:M20 family metallopeptidase [Ornithinimicrobium sp. HY1793]USQ78918.1 M20 family metallopeptidase [Ornithinimicrobium sp. HY1793]
MPTSWDSVPLTSDIGPVEARVLDLIDPQALVELTQALVRAPGQNPPGEEAASAAVLAAACRDRGLEVEISEVAPGRPNVSATLPAGAGGSGGAGGAGGGLLLLGHTDVVPPGEGWSADPYEGGLRDGRLYGRGTADMKGGLAACVVALDALRRSGVSLSGPVELAALVDEEETGLGIHHYMTADRSAFRGCVVAEPTDLQTIVAARGAAYVEVAVHGVAAHSGRPDDGRNAIYGAARVIEELRRWHGELAARAHPLVGPPTWSVGLVDGGQGTSTVPAHAHLSVDRRLLPGEDAEQVLADVHERLGQLGLADDGLTFEVWMPMSMPGFETPADHPFVAATDRALQESGGPGLELAGWTAACDGGFLARDAGVPTLVLGPGSVNDQAHRPDESVAVEDLLIAARTYALLALRLLT